VPWRGYAAGGIFGRALGAAWGTVAGWFGRGAAETGGTVAGEAFTEGQQVLRTIQTAEGPLQVTAKVEIEGEKLVLKNFSVSHAEGIGVKTNPGVSELKAAFDAIKADARAAGFSSVRVTALSIRDAPEVIDKTFILK
jgi:hypothetical protein